MRTALVLAQDASIAPQLVADGFTLPTDSSTQSAFGPLTVIVCELISPAVGSFSETPDWARIVSDAVAIPFQQVRAILPRLTGSADARIIIVIDGWRTAAPAASTAAAAANGALIALVKTLARDLGPDGITVNAIARGPGLARAVSYLASPLAGALTGQIVTLGSGGEIRP